MVAPYFDALRGLLAWGMTFQIGNVTGYPGVFPGNPHPYPSKPVPASTGAGFDKYGCGFCKNPRVYNPSTGAPSNTDRENIS